MPNFNSVLYQILGARLKARREQLGINQVDLGDRAGIGRTSISNIEQGRQKPPLSVIYKICKVLDSDIQNILPTYTEIQDNISISKKDDIESVLNKLDVDKKTLREITNLINQTKK